MWELKGLAFYSSNGKAVQDKRSADQFSLMWVPYACAGLAVFLP